MVSEETREQQARTKKRGLADGEGMSRRMRQGTSFRSGKGEEERQEDMPSAATGLADEEEGGGGWHGGRQPCPPPSLWFRW